MASEPAMTVKSATEMVAAEMLKPEEMERAKEIAAELDIKDTVALTGFATKAQKDLTSVTDPILKMVTTKDAGPAGEALTSLLDHVKEMKADSLAGQAESILESIPVIGKLFDKGQQFISRYEKIGDKVDRIVVDLEGSKQTLLRDITMLDQLYAQNEQYYRELLVHIGAGELKLAALKAEQAELADKAKESGDSMMATQANDMNNLIARLERRIYDLKLTAMISLQSAPQIRLVQGSDQSLVEKIQSSILTTIPLWKNQIIIAIAVFNQKKALELQKSVTDTTNELLNKNAEMLRQGVTEVARETERGIVELETLANVNNQLIATIEEALSIQTEGRKKRQEGEKQLEELQKQLRDALTRTQSAS